MSDFQLRWKYFHCQFYFIHIFMNKSIFLYVKNFVSSQISFKWKVPWWHEWYRRPTGTFLLQPAVHWFLAPTLPSSLSAACGQLNHLSKCKVESQRSKYFFLPAEITKLFFELIQLLITDVLIHWFTNLGKHTIGMQNT